MEEMGKTRPSFIQQDRRKAIAVSRAITKRRGSTRVLAKFPSRRRHDHRTLLSLEKNLVEQRLNAVLQRLERVKKKGRKPSKEHVELAAKLKEDRMYIIHYPPNKKYVPILTDVDGMEAHELDSLRQQMRKNVKQDILMLTEIHEGRQQCALTREGREPSLITDSVHCPKVEQWPSNGTAEGGRDGFFLYSSEDEEEEEKDKTEPSLGLPTCHSGSWTTAKFQGIQRPRTDGDSHLVTRKLVTDAYGQKLQKHGTHGHSNPKDRMGSHVPILRRRTRAEGGRKRCQKKK